MLKPRTTVSGVMALAFAALGGCAPEQQSEDVGEVAMAVRIVPADVRCVRLAVDQNGAVVSRSFDSEPGTSLSARIGGLAFGFGVLTAQAFDAPCAQVTTGSQPRWVSEAIGVLVSAVPTPVSLTMRQSGALDVDLDFDPGTDAGCPAGPGQCPVSDLVGRWTFDEASGATVNDVGPNNQAGTIVTGKAVTGEAATEPTRDGMGKSGNALTAGGQWVRVPASQAMNSTGENNAVTVSSWVKLTRDPGEGNFAVVTRAEDATNYVHFGLGIVDRQPSARIHFTSVTAAEQLPVGRWVHLATTYDGITARLYVDAQEAGWLDIGWPILADVTPLIIGARQALDGVTEFFPGSIDDVRLFNRALTAAEITALVM